MTRFGALNNTNTTTTDFTGASGSTYYFCGGDVSEGGTLDTFYFFAGNRSGNSAFNDFDWAVYAGGSSSGPDGASFVWGSSDYQAVDIGNTPAWQSESASGSFSAGYLWFVLRSNDGIQLGLCNDTDGGDLDGSLDTRSVTGSSGPGASWPGTFTGNGASIPADLMKVAVDYTAASGGGEGAAAYFNFLKRRQ